MHNEFRKGRSGGHGDAAMKLGFKATVTKVGLGKLGGRAAPACERKARSHAWLGRTCTCGVG